MKKNWKKITIIFMCVIIAGIGLGYIKKSAMKVTGEEKAAIESRVQHAATQKYKEMDYGFLKSYEFGNVDNSTVNAIYEYVEALLESDDPRLRQGNKVRTQ